MMFELRHLGLYLGLLIGGGALYVSEAIGEWNASALSW